MMDWTDAAIAARAAIARDGYLLLPRIMGEPDCVDLGAGFPATASRAGGSRNALRGSLGAHSAPRRLDQLADTLLDAPARPVRAILFDKSPSSNWAVAWHQDLSIAVEARGECVGFRNWSLKDDVWHVQPPHEVLEGMLALRLHLDDCGAGNAPLRVLPGSHLHGRLGEERIASLLAASDPVACIARAGDVLAMRPGLLHASERAGAPARRRVLHIEYAAHDLPAPLRWHDPRLA